ncbi:DNA internalization-related competence protein ComEC/Rec2 [Candidatus Uhrbacteria bacterium]|nr:DNA internalization-related competence protein ComEC/Rec2 [Candidatus Uhrbacteria bacterium]
MVFAIMGWDLEEWLKRKSNQFACVFAGVPFGVAIASFVISPTTILVGLSVLLCAAGLRMKWRAALCLISFVGFLWGGFLRFEILSQTSPPAFPKERIVLSGWVGSLPTVRGSSQRFTFASDAYGEVLAYVPRSPRLVGGERLSISCRIERPEPFDGFAYDRFLAVRGIYGICRTFEEPARFAGSRLLSPVQRVQLAVRNHAATILHEPYASLLLGFLTGEDLLPAPIEEAFRRAGLAHLVVASGQNVALLSSFAFSLFISFFLSRKKATALTVLVLLGYVFLAGAEAPIIRATVMGAIVLFGCAGGRSASTRNVLLFALTLMLLLEPRLLRDDLGFQLSFASVTGLLLFEEKLNGLLSWVPATGGLRSALASSLAAILATAPILAFSSTTFSLVAPLANLFVLPVLPFVMGLGLGVLGLSFVSVFLARALALPLVGGLSYILELSGHFARLPFASFTPREHPLALLAILLGSAFSIRFLLRRIFSGTTSRTTYPVFALAGLFLVLSLPSLWRAIPHHDLRVFSLSIGQGDATLLEFPNGARWLVDAGPDNTVLWKVGQILPWFDRHIDTLVLTHADADHVTGAEELVRRYDIERILLPEIDRTSPTIRALKQDVPERLHVVTAPETFTESSVVLDLLSPSPDRLRAAKDRNDASLVLRLTYGETTLLLTGDISSPVEVSLVDRLGHIDVLKTAHHGSKTSTSAGLLGATTPTAAIISAGENNRYGHPHASVLERLKRFRVQVFRTDTDGDIFVKSKGEEPILTTHALSF